MLLIFKRIINYFRFLNNDILYIEGKRITRKGIIKELIEKNSFKKIRYHYKDHNVYIPTGSKGRYNSHIKIGTYRKMSTKDLYYALKSNGYICYWEINHPF